MKIKLADNEGLSVVLSAGGQFVLPDVQQGQVFVPGSSKDVDFAVKNSTLSAYYKGNSNPAKMTWRFECPSPLNPDEVMKKLYYDAESPQHDEQIMWEVLTHTENAYYPKSGQVYIYTTSADTSCTFDVYNYNTSNEYTISAYRTDVTIVGYKLGSQDPVLANADNYVFSALTVNGKALSSDIVLNASDVSATTKADVFLTPQFDEWVIDPPSYQGIPYEIRLLTIGIGLGYYQLYWKNIYRGTDNSSKYDSTAVSFIDPTTGGEVSATRNFIGRYILGDQDEKLLADAKYTKDAITLTSNEWTVIGPKDSSDITGFKIEYVDSLSVWAITIYGAQSTNVMYVQGSADDTVLDFNNKQYKAYRIKSYTLGTYATKPLATAEQGIKAETAVQLSDDIFVHISGDIVTGDLSINKSLSVYTNQDEVSSTITVGTRLGGAGKNSFSQGWNNYISGECACANGILNYALGKCSHAEGAETSALATGAHSSGLSTCAGISDGVGDYSSAEGIQTSAFGYGSHATGFSTIAQQTATGSFVAGISCETAGQGSFVCGVKATDMNEDRTAAAVASFVWQGANPYDPSTAVYNSHGHGTFCINPAPVGTGETDPASGFFIGNTSIKDMFVSKSAIASLVQTVNNTIGSIDDKFAVLMNGLSAL